MGNKTKATPEEAREKGPETPDAPLPLLDLSGAAVTKMIQQAAKRGYVTYEQLNAVMPSLTPDGRAIDTRPSDARPPLAADATDHVVEGTAGPLCMYAARAGGARAECPQSSRK